MIIRATYRFAKNSLRVCMILDGFQLMAHAFDPGILYEP